MVKTRSRIYPLLTDVQIQQRVQELGAQITADYIDKDLLVIGLLNGVYMFFADLTRAIGVDMCVSFMRASSYGDNLESNGEVKIILDIDKPIKDRHILIVEDIVDTGFTLHKVHKKLLDLKPASLRTVTLLDKPCRRKVQVPVDYVGFQIDDHFVVGYGLDFEGVYRNLPFVGVYDLM